MFINIPLPEIPDIPASSQVSATASGGSSASVNVVNVVNSNSSGGTQTVHIETSVDGQTHVEDYTKDIPAGGSDSITYTYATSTSSGSSTTGVRVHSAVRTHGTTTSPRVHATTTWAGETSSTTWQSASSTVHGLRSTIINRLSTFFSSFFGIFISR
jgi:hypothetical protein